MKITITFRHTQATPAIKEYAQEKVERLGRYVDDSSEAHVVLSAEKKYHSAEVVVTSKGVQATGTAETGDMYASIDAAITKAEKTLKRFHDKKITNKHHPKNNTALA